MARLGQARQLIYREYTQEELNAQYDAASTVPSLEPFLARYSDDSARTRSELHNERVAYGTHDREQVDLFRAERPGSPLFVFVHGGYWRRLEASFFSFVAGPVVRAGGACALVNYPLAPEASLDEIVDSVRRCFTWIVANAARLHASTEGIVVGGHSAGGQLAGMLAAADWAAAPAPISGLLGLSGLYDVEPLRRANVNDWLRLPDEAAALRNSPVAHLPAAPLRVLTSAGGLESDEFRRQSLLYADACASAGLDAVCVEADGHNHYTIVSELAGPSKLTATLLEMLHLPVA